MAQMTIVPKTGTIVPEMGKERKESARKGLAAALFTPVQRRVLGLLFGQPDRRFQSAELIRLAGSGTGAVHRQLQRLADSGLIVVTWVGSQKHYQANRSSPIYSELHGLVVKTVGLVEPLRLALESFADRIDFAFVFGSVAKGTERAGSDLDLLIVGDDVDYVDVYQLLAPAEATLARKINPMVMTRDEWARKRATKDSFVQRIDQQARILVLGTDHATA